MKRTVSLTLVFLLLLAALLPGCGKTAPAAPPAEDKLSIVTTIFPVYDWVRNLLGERASAVELTMLLDSGVDLHSYQPTVEDMVKISGCDLFIYVGGESDGWVDDALREAANKDMIVINLLETLGDSVKEEELVEGMEAEEEEDEDEEGPEYDEHVWLSLRSAGAICTALAEALARLDPAHAEDYAANAAAYAEKLDALDGAYRAAVDAAPGKTLLFGDRFPFRYLVDDYGLSYYAAFVGCSAETEASFETVVFLAQKTDELGLRTICQIESADGSIARTIRENTRDKDQQILSFDSMQSVTAEDVAAGKTYLGIMEENLAVLREALQ